MRFNSPGPAGFDGRGRHFIFSSVAPGTYRVYAWERLAPISDGPVTDALVFPDPEFPRLFDSMSSVVTLVENDSKEVSPTLISAAKMDAESRGRY